jgi:hypothetical protein
MATTCPNGHQSTTSDYCDQCGARLGGASPDPALASAPDPATGMSPGSGTSSGARPAAPVGAGCPNCASPIGPRDKFCEVCGYDFVAGTLPSAPAPVPAAPDTAVSPGTAAGPGTAEPPAGPAVEGLAVEGLAVEATAVSAAAPRSAAGAWTAVVSADRAYYDSLETNEMPFPEHCPERTFALTADEILIGRRSETRGIHPQIDLGGAPEDTGISRSHALLRRQADGGYVLVDPGSTNGTLVNDDPEPIAHNVSVPVADGDRFYVGGWTRIVFRSPGPGAPQPGAPQPGPLPPEGRS